MDERTLTALKKSIQHWESIAEGIGISRGIETCALCQIYHCDCNGKEYHDNCCGTCPVKKETGYDLCIGSPYQKWGKHRMKEHPGADVGFAHGFALCKECKEIAWEEVAFLKSLLP